MLIIESLFKQERDKIKVHRVLNWFSFLKWYILGNGVFLFHVSVNSVVFFSNRQILSIICLITLQKSVFYFLIWNTPIFLLFNSNISPFNSYEKMLCYELNYRIITFLHLWKSCVWGFGISVSLTCICLISFLN